MAYPTKIYHPPLVPQESSPFLFLDCVTEGIKIVQIQQLVILCFKKYKKDDLISTDQLNHEQYRNDVFLPYIAKCREHYLQSEEWKQGNPVDDDNVWINWQVSAAHMYTSTIIVLH